MAIKAAREALSREEIIDILKRNVSLYKNDSEFAEYFANLAYCLAECYGSATRDRAMSEFDSDDPRTSRAMASMDEVSPPTEFVRSNSIPTALPLPPAPVVSGPAPITTTGIPATYQMPPTAAQRAAGMQGNAPRVAQALTSGTTPVRPATGYVPAASRDDVRPPTTFHRPQPKVGAIAPPTGYVPGQQYQTPSPLPPSGPRVAMPGSQFDVNSPGLGSGTNETGFGVQRANYGHMTPPPAPPDGVGEQSGRIQIGPSDRTKVYKVIRSYQSTQSKMDANFCPVCGTDCETDKKCPNCGHLI